MGLNFQYRFDLNLNMGFSDKLVPDYDAGGIGYRAESKLCRSFIEYTTCMSWTDSAYGRSSC